MKTLKRILLTIGILSALVIGMTVAGIVLAIVGLIATVAFWVWIAWILAGPKAKQPTP